MKLAVAVLTCCVAMAGGAVAAPDAFAGTWKYDARIQGVIGFLQLTFTPDGRLIADGKTLLGAYQVQGKRAVARSSFGETYAYDLRPDGRLCVVGGPGLEPLTGRSARSDLAGTPCFRRADTPA